MEIRYVPKEYDNSIKQILAYCFQQPPEPGITHIDEGHGSKECLGCFDGDILAGLLYINPFEMFYFGKTLPMGGIGGVSTLPEYRHCRCASGMLIKSLEIMRDKGYVFSALGPFSYPFYRKYGWELGFHTKRYNIPIKELKGLGKGRGEFRPLELSDIDNLMKIYGEFFSRYNGAVYRSEKNWGLRIKGLGQGPYGYAYCRQGNGIDGYIIYSMVQGTFYIHEMVYGSLETKLEIMRFIYLHSAQVREVVWKAPQDDNTMLLLDNPRIEQRIEPGMMIRVLDVKRALEGYAYPLLYKGSFTIRVEDKWAKWNNETLRVIIGEGTATVENADNAPIDLECDIQIFSQIISGYISMHEAIELGKITAHNLGLLEDMKIIFRSHVTHMTDMF